MRCEHIEFVQRYIFTTKLFLKFLKYLWFTSTGEHYCAKAVGSIPKKEAQ